MTRTRTAFVLGVAALMLTACTASDQKTANERADEAQRKLDHAGEIAKRDAAQAGKKLDRAALIAKVKTAMAMDAGLRSLKTVNVDVSGDTVLLTGTVPSTAEKEQVERAVSHVDGVAHVVDNLTVQ